MEGRILFIDTVHDILENGLLNLDFTCEHDYQCSSKELSEKIKDYTGLVLRSRLIIDRKILDNATSLKFIARSGSGMENIDTEYAASKGIVCVNSPEGNKDAVGEHALGMLLSMMNKIHTANQEVRSGIWNREENRGQEIGFKTIGIVGFGNTGSAFAEKLSGFGCRILSYDNRKSDYAPEYVEEVALTELYENCDVISLHIPLNKENAYFANDEFFEAFKHPIHFINTSRGPVLETAALVRAIKSGKVKSACLDVLEYEKSSFQNLDFDQVPEDLQYLLKSDRTLLTPHVAGWTKESYEKLSSVLLEKIKKNFEL